MFSIQEAKNLLGKFGSANGLYVPPEWHNETNTLQISSFLWKEVQVERTPLGRIKIVLVSLAARGVTQEITVDTPEEMNEFLTKYIPRRKMRMFAECITELHSRIVELERCL